MENKAERKLITKEFPGALFWLAALASKFGIHVFYIRVVGPKCEPGKLWSGTYGGADPIGKHWIHLGRSHYLYVSSLPPAVHYRKAIRAKEKKK